MSIKYGTIVLLSIVAWTMPKQIAVAQQPVSPKTSIEKILARYDTYDLILFAESHGNQEIHKYLEALLTHSKSPEVIDDIVVEFGNALFQPLVDRYVFGASVPQDSLALVWRNHTIPFTWDSPLYLHFFTLIRTMNAKLPKDKQIRVLLGDPPIDWAAVKTTSDYEKHVSQRDYHPYTVLKKHVLDKGRKALVIYGGTRLIPIDLKTGQARKDSLRATIGQLIQENHPKKAFHLWTMSGQNNAWTSLGFRTTYDVQLVKASSLQKQSFQTVYAQDIYVQEEVQGEKNWVPLAKEKWVSMDKAVDGILYLGPTNTTMDADRRVYTNSYLQELERRAKIIDQYFGFDWYKNQVNTLREN